MDQPSNSTVVQLIETPYDLADKNIVCYPNLILLFKIQVPRLFMTPRTVYSAITVDLVKGEAARSNMYPKSQPIEIPEDALIPRLTSNDEAIDTAQKLVMRWLRHKFKIYKAPEIELSKQQEVHKAFFYTRNHKDEVLLVDSVKGIELEQT